MIKINGKKGEGVGILKVLLKVSSGWVILSTGQTRRGRLIQLPHGLVIMLWYRLTCVHCSPLHCSFSQVLGKFLFFRGSTTKIPREIALEKMPSNITWPNIYLSSISSFFPRSFMPLFFCEIIEHAHQLLRTSKIILCLIFSIKTKTKNRRQTRTNKIILHKCINDGSAL